MPHKTLLPASCRSSAWHGAFPHLNCRRSGRDARAAWTLFRPLSAKLCAGYSRWTRQIADRPSLSERRRNADHRFQRCAASLSAAQSRLGRNVLACGKEHCGLEFVAAVLARPSVPDTALIEIFRPVRSEQPLAALRTMVLAVCGQARLCRRLGMQRHGSSSLEPENPEPPSAQGLG